MKKTMKYGIIATVVILILLYFGLKAARAAKYRKMQRNGSGTMGPGNGGSKTSVFPLKRGSRGEKVKALQKALNVFAKNSNMNTINADGVFGPKTENLLFTLFGIKQVDKDTYESYAKIYETAGSWFDNIFLPL